MNSDLLSAPIAPWASEAATQRLGTLQEAHQEDSAESVLAAVSRISASQTASLSARSINLYAGSNVMSPRVESAHTSELSTRPALGWPGEKVQPGIDGIEGLEVVAIQQLRRAFNASFAEPRFITATMANLAAYCAFTEPGDTIAILPPNGGNHASHQMRGTAGVRGLRTEHLPYSDSRLDIDSQQLEEFMRSIRPRMILVGGSVIQFPTNIAPLRDAADKFDAKLVFDASHVAGLIAAGEFPNPLNEGVDLMTFSTYKTLAGPAGGAAVSNCAEVAEQVSHALYPVLSSNYDPARMGPLAVATAEAVEQAPAWASATVDVAKAIGERLSARGFKVQGAALGFTDSHQVVVDASEFGGGEQAMRTLEAHGILVGACRIAAHGAEATLAGVRFGTQEIVRLGAGLEHVEPIVDLIAAALRSSGEPSGTGAARSVRQSFGADIWGTLAP